MTVAHLLTPAIVLVLWTIVMLGWTGATRFPAMAKAGMDLRKAAPGGRGQDLDPIIPPSVAWKAHNHTHLHEQPTLFYAVIGALALLGAATDMNVALAWAYVGLRIVHSIWQATVNVVRIRFMLFVVSTVVLAWLAINALLASL